MQQVHKSINRSESGRRRSVFTHRQAYVSNGNLIICDPEEGYAQALAYYLMHKKEFGMEVQVYDRIEKVQEIADRTKIQILFVAGETKQKNGKKYRQSRNFC